MLFFVPAGKLFCSTIEAETELRMVLQKKKKWQEKVMEQRLDDVMDGKTGSDARGVEVCGDVKERGTSQMDTDVKCKG